MPVHRLTVETPSTHRSLIPEELEIMASLLQEAVNARLGTLTARVRADPPSDVVWQGTVHDRLHRVRRPSPDELIAECRNRAYGEHEGRAWEATDDEDASLCFEKALIARL